MSRFARAAGKPLLVGLLAAALLAACERRPEPPRHVDLVSAPVGDEVPALVRAELARASADRRDLLVYVGATWCEPCQRFHRAAAAGQLDASFPSLRLLEFDSDRDSERLASAGYRSRLIPLFAVPSPDGRASGRQIEGSIKGEGAVAQIAPRLRALLGKPDAPP